MAAKLGEALCRSDFMLGSKGNKSAPDVWTSSEHLRHLGSSFTRVAGLNLILLPLLFWSLLCDLTCASPPPSSCWRSRRLHFKLLFPPPAVPFLPTVVAYCALIFWRLRRTFCFSVWCNRLLSRSVAQHVAASAANIP